MLLSPNCDLPSDHRRSSSHSSFHKANRAQLRHQAGLASPTGSQPAVASPLASPQAENENRNPLDDDNRPMEGSNSVKAIDGALTADEKEKQKARREAGASRESSRSRSQARDRRASTPNVWAQDKEKKNRTVVQKLTDHHWVPDFLK